MDKTLLKGLRVLEAVAEAKYGYRNVEQLAAQLGLTRDNTLRTLQTLVHAGYVLKEHDGEYRGTARLFELGARQLARVDIRGLALPAMQILADRTAETVHLSILDGLDVVYIEKIDCPQPIRTYSVIGERAPAYAVATGKALLAHQSDKYLERFNNAMTQHTAATFVSLDRLKDELRLSEGKGYAVNRGEWRDGVGGIAAAVFNSTGQAVAAVGLSVPLDRLTLKMEQFAVDVVACGKAISEKLSDQSSQ